MALDDISIQALHFPWSASSTSSTNNWENECSVNIPPPSLPLAACGKVLPLNQLGRKKLSLLRWLFPPIYRLDCFLGLLESCWANCLQTTVQPGLPTMEAACWGWDIKSKGSGVRQTWLAILPLPFPACATSAELLTLSGSQFLH